MSSIGFQPGDELNVKIYKIEGRPEMDLVVINRYCNQMGLTIDEAKKLRDLLIGALEDE